jgi:ABC-type Zn2+ transport system substrate-binding protein/surface adhesin
MSTPRGTYHLTTIAATTSNAILWAIISNNINQTAVISNAIKGAIIAIEYGTHHLDLCMVIVDSHRHHHLHLHCHHRRHHHRHHHHHRGFSVVLKPMLSQRQANAILTTLSGMGRPTCTPHHRHRGPMTSMIWVMICRIWLTGIWATRIYR